MHFAATISLSSFLLFLVQPLIARLILPWFGGSAAVWTTCMLFFQALLLAGYAYAHFLIKVVPGGRKQALLHTTLLVAAGAALSLFPAHPSEPPPRAGRAGPVPSPRCAPGRRPFLPFPPPAPPLPA